MAYTPTVYTNDNPPAVSAANLNKSENGIASATATAEYAKNGVSSLIPYTNTGYVKRDGTISESTGWGYSDYIPVEFFDPNVNVYFHNVVATFAFYNSSKSYLSYYGKNVNGMAQDTVPIPDNAKYVRVSVNLSYDNKAYYTYQIGEEVKDSREGYDGTLYASSGDAIRGQVEGVYGHLEVLKTLIPLSHTGGYINRSGEITANTSMGYSDYIPVELFYRDVKIYFHNVVATFSFYNSNKTYLSYYGKNVNGVTEDTVPIPANTAYVRVSTYLEGYDYKVYQTDEILKDLEKYDGFEESIANNKASLVSAIPAGYAVAESYGSEKYTNTGIEEYTQTYSGTGNAYTNGAKLEAGSKVTSIKLSSNCNTTKFNIHFFDENWALLHSITELEPTITNHIFELPQPYELTKAGYVMIRFWNGTWAAKRLGTNALKEYRSENAVYDSPIQASFDCGFQDVEKIKFVQGISIGPELSDFNMPKTIKSDSGEYSLIGRWFDKDGYKCANADGSSILFKVKGASSVTVEFDALSTPNYEPYFAYSIDGGAFTRQHISSASVTLPDTNEHLVWIVVDGMGETDPTAGKWNGTVGLKLIQISGGTLNAVDTKNKQILFVGDSIVEGINALGSGANANTNSATAGFAFKTARKLNAIPLMCGYGGSCVLGNGSFVKAIDAVQYNMNNVPVNLLTPDVILIEHGYNDATLISRGVYTTTDFVNGYTALINCLRVMYTGIPIICMIPFKQSLAQYIRDVAAEFSNCYVIETGGYDIDYTDTAHPSASGATSAAESLSADIQDLFGKTYFFDI